MPQSLANIMIHVVFSTKDRNELIVGDLEKWHLVLHGKEATVLFRYRHLKKCRLSNTFVHKENIIKTVLSKMNIGL